MEGNGLVLTLGHGSSAIYIVNNEVLCGYQTERLTKIKGDSRFPMLAIEEISKHYYIPENVDIYISHWHPSGHVEQMNQKHYDEYYIKRRFPNSKIISVDNHFTHHDAHAYSATAYNTEIALGDAILVADGFGTFGEVISLYTMGNNGPDLVKRVFGFSNSLGLLYQFATDYVGLKQNQDEWKLNALASHCPENKVHDVYRHAQVYASNMIERHKRYQLGSDDPITNIGALSATHFDIAKMLNERFHVSQRAEIAFFLQCVVEEVFSYWIEYYDIKRLTVAGGCFLNVQLNGYLSEQVQSFCAMPLSGDEGAGLGIFKLYNPEFYIRDDLCWGIRDLIPVDDNTGIYYLNHEAAKAFLRKNLKEDKIVNIVRGKMEFGPRAYCNTSTLALPSEENRQYINMVNQRDEHMPMCPVVSVDQYSRMFISIDGIVRSVRHMIVALPIKEQYAKKYLGVVHWLLARYFTARPQVVGPDHWMYSIVMEFGPLINTSFNNHGKPICLSVSDAILCHQYMKERDKEDRVVTIIEVNHG